MRAPFLCPRCNARLVELQQRSGFQWIDEDEVDLSDPGCVDSLYADFEFGELIVVEGFECSRVPGHAWPTLAALRAELIVVAAARVGLR